MMSDLRPVNHLNAAMKLYPDAPRLIDELRASRGADLPKWPAWCFLPMAGWYAIVGADLKMSVLTQRVIGDVGRLAALMTWRYSQGVYRVDPDMLSALSGSEINGDIPSEVLFRLPEWCVYIETPGMTWFGDALYGFWTHLEWDTKTERTELRLLLDRQSALEPIPVHIGPWPVTEAIERASGESVAQASEAGIKLPSVSVDAQAVAAQIMPLISLVLYLCSDEPEINDDRTPGEGPKKPSPKKTKRGWRLFPAERPRIWSVGQETGSYLRASSEAGMTGGSVKPHLRRAHWHGYWTGKRGSGQKFIYKWIAPTVIGGAP